jgi:hypothetical protein
VTSEPSTHQPANQQQFTPQAGTHQRPIVVSSHVRATPKPAAVGPAPLPRIAVGTAGFAAVAVAIVAAAATLPRSGVDAMAVAFVMGLGLVPLVAAPLEWFVHRWVYHEPVVPLISAVFTVHTAHHHSYFPTWRYVTHGPARRLPITRRNPREHHGPLRNVGVRLAHFSWYMAIGAAVIWWPAWWATSNWAFMAGVLVASAIVSNLFIVVHDTIHRPGSHRLVEAQPWFAFLDRHHYIHHVALGANLNFLLPLADAVFGTLRTQLTDAELAAHGPLELAKSRPVGQGERARSLPVG